MFSKKNTPKSAVAAAGLESSQAALLAAAPAADLSYAGPIPSLEEATFDLVELESEISGLESLCMDAVGLDALHGAMESHGLSRSLLAFADRDKLLSTAITTIPSLESMGSDFGVYEPETVASMEGVMDAIKNTVAKVTSKAAEVAGKVKDVVVRMGAAVAEKAKQFGAWAKGKVLNAKATIQAHPKATVFALLAGIAAIAAVVALMWGVPVPATPAAFTTWGNNIFKAAKNIKLPGLSVVGDSVRNLKFDFKIPQAVKNTVEKLGWVANEIDKVSSEFGDIIKNSGPVGKVVNLVATKMGPNAALFVKNSVGDFSNGFAKGLIIGTISNLIMATLKLVRVVIGGIFSLVGALFGALRRAFSGGDKGGEGEAAAAAA